MREKGGCRGSKDCSVSDTFTQLGSSSTGIISGNFKIFSGIPQENRQVSIILIKYLDQQSGMARLMNCSLSH